MMPLLLFAIAAAAAAPTHAAATAAANYSRGSLPPILEFVNGSAVVTPAQWPARRQEIGELLQAHFYGTLPPGPPPPIRTGVLLNSTSQRGYTVDWYNVTFATPVADCSTVFEVVMPARCAAASPCPLSLMSKEHRRWQLGGLARGYVAVNYNGGDNGCLPDASCKAFDPTACFARAYPASTFQLIARRAYLAHRVLDFVLLLPGVNTAQVGMAGHSRNGKSALVAAAFDSRIAAVVDSSSGAAGISSYRLSGGDAGGETPSSGWPGPWFLPSLTAFDGSEDALPVDAHCVAGLIAPRPLLLAMATNDGVLSSFSVEASLGEARAAYDFLGAPPGALQVDYRPGDHHGYESPPRYFDFFDAAFGRRPSFPPPPRLFHAFNWSAWAAVQPSPPPLPAPNATALDRVLWMLGDAPAPGPLPDPGGTYPPAEDLVYVDALQLHDAQASGCPDVKRTAVAFGPNIISGSLTYRSDMLTRPPPTPAGWPAVVWLHGPNYNKGWEASYPLTRTDVPHALANASFVTLTFEQLGFGLRLGEGALFYDRFPRWSRLGALVHDAVSAVDVLTSPQGGFHPAGQPDALPRFPTVDTARVYLAGHSIGGTVALLAGALDGRVAGVASLSGWTPLRTDTDASRSGGIRRWWQLHATTPRLGYFAADQAALPVDFDAVLALLAPKPLLVYQPLRDRMNSAAGVNATVLAAVADVAGGWPSLLLQMPPDRVNGLDAPATSALLEWLAAQ